MTSGRREGRREGGGARQRISKVLLVQELETVTFERQHQYSSLFGRLESDQRKVCELERLGAAPLTST